jgi:hypothetical protein
MKSILVAVAVMSFLAPCMHGQTILQRKALSSAAVRGQNASGMVQGTLGQTIIGRATASSELAKGFWYRVPKAVASIVIPSSEGDIGTTVRVPVILAASRNLIPSGTRDVVITLRYNRTILVNKSTFPSRFDGDDALLTIAAQVKDTIGIIAEVPFLVALGNAETSQLHIESVEWPASPFIRTSRTDGEFTVLGICREGDSVRLIKRGGGTGIVGIAPMPVTTQATITFSAGHEGMYKIIVVDAFGREYATLANQTFAAGRHTVDMPASMVPSGQYHVVLLSERETHSRAMVIEK